MNIILDRNTKKEQYRSQVENFVDPGPDFKGIAASYGDALAFLIENLDYFLFGEEFGVSEAYRVSREKPKLVLLPSSIEMQSYFIFAKGSPWTKVLSKGTLIQNVPRAFRVVPVGN